MKRVAPALVLILSVLIVLSPAYPGESDGGTLVEGDFSYHVETGDSGEYAVVDHYSGDSGRAVVPETVGGFPVAAIGEGCFMMNETLTQVVLPETLVAVCDSAFSYCENLGSLELPESLTSIGAYAFSYCSSVKEVVIPCNVGYIGDYAFKGMTSLERMKVEARELNQDTVLDISDAYVMVDRGIRIAGQLVLTTGDYEVALDQGIMDSLVADDFGLSIKPYDKDKLDLNLLRAVGFAECREVRISGLPEGSQTEIRFGESHYSDIERPWHTVYFIEGKSMIEAEMSGSEDSPSFHVTGSEAVFCYANDSAKPIVHAPTIALAIAVAGTLLCALFVRIERRG